MKERLKKGGDRYHHGNLRDALVRAAEQQIARSGDIALPLRDVARLVGVSHAAAYRHFDSKQALLAEVAARGFEALTVALTAGAARGRGPAERLVEAAVGYVSFALEQPGAYRVMFHATLKPFTRFPRLAEASLAALEVLRALVREGLATKAFSGEADAAVMATWALVHGQALLVLDGQLSGPFGIDAAQGALAARTSMKRLLEGLRR
ncbi:MAG: TetR/AcrR family transcriptional regulator [Myxococcaceae bacterium]|nr:TetR/AcrR family transcriptional regulator [Myxococcaceae bacterium]